MKLALVVPTRNRPEQVGRLLSMIAMQTVKPEVVLVVDGSDSEFLPDVRRVVDEAAGSFEVLLVTVAHPSAPGQRNAGVRALRTRGPLPQFIVFLDDDVEPETSYFEKLLDVFEREPNAGGVSGVSQMQDPVRPGWRRLLARVFLYGEGEAASVMNSGVNIPVPQDRTDLVQAQWLFGCSIWRAEVFDSFRFSELGPGYVLYDDVEFSVRVGKRWRLLVNPNARLVHNQGPVSPDHARNIAYQSIVNRYFVVRHCLERPLGRLAFWWSTFGVVLFSLMLALAGSARARIELPGFLRGVRDLTLGKVVFPKPC